MITKPNNIQLLISNGRILHAVWTNDIKYITSDGGYAVVHLNDHRRIVTSKNLKEVMQIIPDTIFIRVNHGVIINRYYIGHIKNRESNIISMKDGEEIQISKRKKMDFYNSFVRL